MSLPSEPPRQALKRLGARPWEWPTTEFPVAVPVGPLLFDTTGSSAVAITGLMAYRSGFEFFVTRLLRPDGPGFMHGLGPHPPAGRSPATAGITFEIGLEFADGRRVFTSDRISPDEAPAGDGPIMHPGWSMIRGHRTDSRRWVWPLPPPGQLDFICRLNDDETRVGLDARLVLDASRQSVPATWRN